MPPSRCCPVYLYPLLVPFLPLLRWYERRLGRRIRRLEVEIRTRPAMKGRTKAHDIRRVLPEMRGWRIYCMCGFVTGGHERVESAGEEFDRHVDVVGDRERNVA